MNILANLFGPTSRNLEKALDRTSQRHGLLSSNLANVNVANYKRKDIDFGIELEREGIGRSGLDGIGRKSTGVTSSKGSLRTDGNNVDIEKEVMAIAETELRYQMLTELTNRYFSGLKSVIKEGR